MPCEKLEHVQDLLDGRLSGAAAEAARAHLRGCRECAREAESLQAMASALRRLPQSDPGADFTRAVMRALRPAPARAPEPSWRSLSRWELFGLAALYCAALALIGPAAEWVARVWPAQWALPAVNAGDWLPQSLAGVQRSLSLPAAGRLDAVPTSASIALAAAAAAVLALLVRSAVRVPQNSRISQ